MNFFQKEYNLTTEMKKIIDALERIYMVKCSNCELSKEGCKSNKKEIAADIIDEIMKYYPQEIFSLMRTRFLSSLQNSAEIFSILGPSMFPAIEEGDLVILKRPLNLKTGDIICFYYPNSEGTIIHRIVGKDDSFYYTSGDNCNNRIEKVKKDDIIGKAEVIKESEKPEIYRFLKNNINK